MNLKEEYIFWRMAQFFITELGYRIIQLFEGHKECWLEKVENKEASIIRLHQFKMDWSNMMQRDIELTAANGERIRRQLNRNELKMINILISPFPPVDEYEYQLNQPYFFQENNKTMVHSTLIASGEYESGFNRLTNWIGTDPSFQIKDEYLQDEVAAIKGMVLESAMKRAKKEETLPKNPPFITYSILFIQLAVYIWLETHGGSTNTSTLIKYGAKLNPLIYSGEWWRLITPVFLHIGFIHLAMNSISLFFLGMVTEKIYGKWRFLFIYLFAGFTGLIASFIFSIYLSAGASGAILGCLGALLYYGLAFQKNYNIKLRSNVIFLLVILLSLASGFKTAGIDNVGHFGGLIGGFLAAGIVDFPKRKKLHIQSLFLLMSFIIVLGSLFYGYSTSAKSRNINSYLVLSEDYIQNHQYDQAYQLLKSVEKNSLKPSSQIYFELSYSEIKLGKLSDAKAHLLKTIRLDSTFDEAFYNLALIYIEENDYQSAKKYAVKAVKLKPNQKNYVNLLNEINRNVQSSVGG
ncbi:MAG: rhomboid family intramembrane serine protease [Bacillota bacterium]|nr:rhomboid family intramembrane serine protease [Bacillota bacterium]